MPNRMMQSFLTVPRKLPFRAPSFILKGRGGNVLSDSSLMGLAGRRSSAVGGGMGLR